MKENASRDPLYKLHKYVECDMAIVVFEFEGPVKKHKKLIVKTLRSKLCSEKQYGWNIGLYVSHK